MYVGSLDIAARYEVVGYPTVYAFRGNDFITNTYEFYIDYRLKKDDFSHVNPISRNYACAL